MTVSFKKSGVSTTATIIRFKKAGVMTNATFARRRSGAGWVDCMFTALVASVTNSFPSGEASGTVGSRTVTSSATTASATGGTGGTKTYSWARISGSSSITAGSPAAATTTFSATIADVRDDQPTVVSAVFRCTVSDGTYTATVDVTVTLSYENSLV